MFRKVKTVIIKNAFDLRILVASDEEAEARWDNYTAEKETLKNIKSKKRGDVLTIDFQNANGNKFIHLSYKELEYLVFEDSKNLILEDFNNNNTKLNKIVFNNSSAFFNGIFKNNFTIKAINSKIEINNQIINDFKVFLKKYSTLKLGEGIVHNFDFSIQNISSIIGRFLNTYIINVKSSYCGSFSNLSLNVINFMSYVASQSMVNHSTIYGNPKMDSTQISYNFEEEQRLHPNSIIVSDKKLEPYSHEKNHLLFKEIKKQYNKLMDKDAEFIYSIKVCSVLDKFEMPSFVNTVKQNLDNLLVDEINERNNIYNNRLNYINSLLERSTKLNRNENPSHDFESIIKNLEKESKSFRSISVELDEKTKHFQGREIEFKLPKKYAEYKKAFDLKNELIKTSILKLKKELNLVLKEEESKEKEFKLRELEIKERTYLISILNEPFPTDVIQCENRDSIINLLKKYGSKMKGLSNKESNALEKLLFVFDIKSNTTKSKLCSF